MYAIAFDLVIDDIKQHYNGYPSQAYLEIRAVLEGHGFKWTQGSLYLLDKEDMAIVFQAIMDLKKKPWFPLCVRDIRAFRVEQWSDFTKVVKTP